MHMSIRGEVEGRGIRDYIGTLYFPLSFFFFGNPKCFKNSLLIFKKVIEKKINMCMCVNVNVYTWVCVCAHERERVVCVIGGTSQTWWQETWLTPPPLYPKPGRARPKVVLWRKCPSFFSQHATLLYKVTNLELIVDLPKTALSLTGDISKENC